MDKDYTGFSTRAFSNIYNKYCQEDLNTVAERVPPKGPNSRKGMDPRDLQRLVVNPEGKFTGLHLADRVMMAIGKNISTLVHNGEIIIVPAPFKGAAMKMAIDEVITRYPEEAEEWIISKLDMPKIQKMLKKREKELIELREEVLG